MVQRLSVATRAVLAAALVAGGFAGLGAGPAVAADDVATAWSVAPAGPDGAADGHTRFDLQLDPGATSAIKVRVSNASTVERTFDVYAADAMNTTTGGYDLRAAAQKPVDVGSWVTTATPVVTVPPLSDVVVDMAVAVPPGATPGDHAGGVVVSLDHPAADAAGVVLDTRVAVRLGVRVSGALAPALTVRDASASSATSLVPFGPAATTVRYEVANTGNVKVVGKPRVRVTGPFGVRLATVAAGATQEVLPGQSFTVETVLPGVVPLGLLTAVVDVDMAAAPGPQTEIPLVSSTTSTTFVAAPWTGLLVLAAVVALVWYLVRRARRRRREGEELWRQMTAAVEPSVPSSFVVAGIVLVAGAFALGSLPAAGTPTPAPSSSGRTIVLTVPAAPRSAGAPVTSLAPGAGHAGSSGSTAHAGSADPVPDGSTAEVAAAAPASVPTQSASTAANAAPDLVWTHRGSWLGRAAWILGILAVLTLGALGVRYFATTRQATAPLDGTPS